MEPTVDPTEAERTAATRLLQALREECSRDPSHAEAAAHWADENVAVRYLRARSQDHDAALRMLLGTVAWRAAADSPQHILGVKMRCPACAKCPTAHCMRWVGFDCLDRPVCYSSFEHALNRSSSEANMMHTAALLESMSARLQQVGKPLDKCVWFVDFKGFGLVDNNPLTGQKVITLLQNHCAQHGLPAPVRT